MTPVLFLDPERPASSRGFAVDERGVSPLSWQEMADLRPVVLAPGEQVLTQSLELPVQSIEKARAAAPFALEDQLAEDPSGLHVALARSENGAWRAAVVSRDVMERWQAALAELGITPARLLPDYAALNLGESARLGNRVLHRREDGTGFALEQPLAAELGIPAELPELTEAKLAEKLDRADSFSLLQGRYRRRHSILPPDLPGLRLTGALAAAVLLVFLAATAADALRLQRLEAHYYRAALETTETALPGTRIVDPERQLRRALGGADDAVSDFLPLAAALSAVVAEVPAAQVQRLRYRDEDARPGLDIEVRYGGFGDLDALRDAAARQGVRIEEQAAQQDDGAVIGRLRLSWAEGG